MPMIAIDDVSKWYGAFQVLTDCTTKVEKGEVIVVCGPSGSGKSTLIKCVNALEPFQKGRIFVDGVPVHDPKTDLPKALEIVKKVMDEVGAEKVESDEHIAKVSIVGVGMRNHAGVAAKAFDVLAAAGINIEMISTSEIKVSMVIAQKFMELAVRELHTAFGLDAPPAK